MNNMHEVPHLCMVTFYGSYGLIRNWGTKCARYNHHYYYHLHHHYLSTSLRALPKPKLTNAIWGAGLSFSKCHAERKVPYDPHTPFIFDGEEFSRAVRFFTYGYDIYTPHRVYIVHNYKDSQSDPKHMTWGANEMRERTDSTMNSVRRLKNLLGYNKLNDYNEKEALEVQQSRYGLGDRRTLQQAIQFSGVDTANSVSLGNYCGDISYVPFKEHPFGPDYIPKYNPNTLKFEDIRDPDSVYFNKSDSQQVLNWINAKTKYDQLNRIEQENIEAPTTYNHNNNNKLIINMKMNNNSYHNHHYLHPNPDLDHTANYILIIFSIGMFILATNWKFLMASRKLYDSANNAEKLV
jgi:hypothetical protein